MRYIRQVNQSSEQTQDLSEGGSPQAIAERLRRSLRSVSAEAWRTTEELLSREVIRHQIAPDLINPWSISGDVYQIYNEALNYFAQGTPAERFAIDISSRLGALRDRYTAEDPRVIGFVSLQFHHTGRLLLDRLHDPEKSKLALFFKAIDDYLYMPLQRAYGAAAQYSASATELRTIHRLLPESSAIAHYIVRQVLSAFPNHHCLSGPLAASQVQVSSVRDVEMFQTYLWVCLLEGNISSVQQELFPLCVMLYPVLNVRWELVRYMLLMLEHETSRRLEPSQWMQYRPYLKSLQMMFSAEVFADQVQFA